MTKITFQTIPEDLNGITINLEGESLREIGCLLWKGVKGGMVRFREENDVVYLTTLLTLKEYVDKEISKLSPNELKAFPEAKNVFFKK